MDLVDQLRYERESDCVAYAEFALIYNSMNNETIYAFYEGFEDRAYYPIRVKGVLRTDKYEDFVCGGKEQVLKVQKLINEHEEYSDANIAYFVDRDFNSSLVKPRLYEFPYYSIENAFYVQEALERILLNNFKLTKADDDYIKILQIYNSIQNEFYNDTLILNSWLACQTAQREEFCLCTKLKIDNKLRAYFSDLISPNLEYIGDFEDLQDKEKIEQIFSESPSISTEVLQERTHEFKELNATQRFRGKFELKLFVQFLNRLQDEIGKKNSVLFSNKRTCSLRFELATILTTLTQDANTPECLIAFLDEIKNVA